MYIKTFKGFCPYDVLELYKKHGLDVGKHLRGDFYIVIRDGNKSIHITDFAGTQSAGIAPRNSTIVLENNEIISRRFNISTIDLHYNPPQGLSKKNNYEDFFKALDEAINFRAKDSPTIYLSEGHDSGAIVTGCIRKKLKFDTLSIINNSAKSRYIILDRLLMMPKYKIIDKANGNKLKNVHTRAHYYLAENTSNKIVLSGLGADEYYISHDYELAEEFFIDASSQYNKFDLDVRYPLLDPNVFREYYLLSTDLRRYPHKKPLIKYMETIRLPIWNGQKISLTC